MDTKINTNTEYGVRREGGHIEAKLSMHMAVREIERRIADGEKNVWLVQRQVEDWVRGARKRG